METTLPCTNLEEEQRLQLLALSTYEMRSRFADGADYDWTQAGRELGFLRLAVSIAELAADFGEGRFRDDTSAIAENVANIRGQAQELFEPIDVNLSEELRHSLARMECALANARHGRAVPSRNGVRRMFSWLKGPASPQPRD